MQKQLTRAEAEKLTAAQHALELAQRIEEATEAIKDNVADGHVGVQITIKRHLVKAVEEHFKNLGFTTMEWTIPNSADRNLFISWR